MMSSNKMCFLGVCFGLVVLSNAYVNVAINKSAYQQNAYKAGDTLNDASNAVDGRKSDLSWDGGQCVVSADFKHTAIWWVNLASIHSIHHITIYYRTDNVAWQPTNGFRARFLGFSVYISNTTDRLEGVLCFKDNAFTLATIPSVLTVTCPVHGQYVIYYNERLQGVTYPTYYDPYAHNELCEVEVYECSANEPSCSSTCKTETCRYCDNTTGNCTGCIPGFQGYQCQLECNDGMFGDVCQSQCGHCLDMSKCHHVNGTCLNGCKPGYTSTFCNQSCPDGTYGTDCSARCGKCRGVGQCNHIDGTCKNGCEIGYNGSKCTEDCDGHLFGENCSKQCGHCLDSVQCHHINGTCMNGCDSGYKGFLCTEACDSNLYGENCSMPCGHCLESEPCHHINGTCINGCDSGYQGPICIEECKANYFGPNCKEKCNSTCTSCNKTTGICDLGCYPGWKGLFCHETCNQKKYGENCSMICGHCLESEQCHHINGTCINGCDRGYQGVKCTVECDKHFGPNCIEKCNTTCKSCDKSSGICNNHCHPGWGGLFCHEPCNQKTYGENCSRPCGQCLGSEQCHHINGTCIKGCVSGYQGLLCSECKDGFFGPNCKKMCNETCKGCNKTTGVCDNGCVPGWKGQLCHEACEFGYYGLGCNQECSTFCKRSRDCYPASGYCKDGCKSGWQGLDCLEDSKLTVTEKNLTSEFNGILSAFCILFFLNGVVIAHFLVKRFRNSKAKLPAIYQSNIAKKECESEVPNVYINDNNRSEYQELGEISKSETYDTLQDVPNKHFL